MLTGARGIRRVFSNRNVMVISLSNTLATFFRGVYMFFWIKWLVADPPHGFGLELEIVALLSMISQSERLLFQLPGGILADRIGRKKVTLLGAASRIATPLIYLFSTSFEHLVIASIFTAMGSLSGPAFTAMIAESLPRDQMGSGYAIYGVTRRIPRLFTGIIGGILWETLGLSPAMRICLIGSFIGAVVTFTVRYLFLTETLVRRSGRRSSIKEDFKEVLPLFKGPLGAMQVTSSISQFAGRLTRSFIIIYLVGEESTVGLTPTQYGFITTTMSTISLITAMPGGMIADKFNRAKLIVFARSISPITTIGYIFLRDFYQILAVRIVAGVGAGLSGAGAMGWMGGAAWSALMADVVPPEKRGRVTGIMGTISGVTSLPSSPVGALMWESDAIGPESTMLTGTALGLISTFIFWKFVKDPRYEEKKIEEVARDDGEEEGKEGEDPAP